VTGWGSISLHTSLEYASPHVFCSSSQRFLRIGGKQDAAAPSLTEKTFEKQYIVVHFLQFHTAARYLAFIAE
jgi:hypothetical protein